MSLSSLHSTLVIAMALVITSLSFGLKASAQLTGVISDMRGAVVPDAKVTATNVDTGIRRVVQSDTRGCYRISFLEPGGYAIVVEKEGFRSIGRSDVKLAARQTARLDFILHVELGHDDRGRQTTQTGIVKRVKCK